MSVTSISVEGRGQYLAAIERLAASHVLHGSESLCKLLRYLAEHSLQNPGVPVKEYQIATEVFGRPADFDPHLDSAIRVQAGRLRVKLGEYYSSEGEQAPVLVELRKGTYTLSFHTRPITPRAQLESESASEEKQKRQRTHHLSLHWSSIIHAFTVLIAAAVAVIVA